MNTHTPANWYPDTERPGNLRYWDGDAWTDDRRPPSAAHLDSNEPEFQPSPPTSDNLSTHAVDGRKPKKVWYKRWWAITLAVLIGLSILGNLVGGGPEPAVDATSTAGQNSAVTVDPAKAAADAAAAELKKSEEAAQNAAAEEAAKKAAIQQAAAEAKQKAVAAAKAKAAAAAWENPATYKSISTRSYALLVKNPDAHIGEKYVIYGRITQFDAATGTDTFRADTAASRKPDWYDYDVNTMATAATESDFANVVNDDLVTMYVEITGSFSYDTQAGGNTTVPQMRVHIIKVTGSTN